MNRNEFLSILKDNLNAFPYEERESAIAYYNEFFDDAGAENEQAVIASLGDPKELAKTILKESGINSEQTYENQNANAVFTPPQTNKKAVNNNDSSKNVLIAILIIISFPIWIGFVAGAFGIIIGLIAAAFGITIGFFAVAAVCLVFGFIQLFVSPPLGILLVGIGLIALGICILAVIPLLKVVVKGLAAMFRGVGRFFKNLFSVKGVNA